MALIHLEKEDLELSKGLVLVDFYAEWCGPCKMLGPILEELSSTYDIIKVDVDKFPSLARKYAIMSVPTLIVFKDNMELDKKSGFMPADVLIDWLDTYK